MKLIHVSVVFVGALLSPVYARVVKYNWHVTQFEAAYDGVKRQVLGINNRPAQEQIIDVTLGDTIEVTMRNDLQSNTGIHWHGMKQRATQEMDGASGVTQCGVAPGKSVVYRFTPSEPGTYWWHGHDKTQYVDDLRGPLIVRYPRQEKDCHKEYVVQIADWYHTWSNQLLSQMLANPSGNEPVWETVLINGKGQFNCDVLSPYPQFQCTKDQPYAQFKFVQGKTYKLRLINIAAFAAFDFSIDGHEFRIVEVDGVPIETTQLLTNVQLNIGQRYSIIVQATQSSGNFWLRATSLYGDPWTSLPPDQFPIGFNPYGLGIIKYVGNEQEEENIDLEVSSNFSTPSTSTKLSRKESITLGTGASPEGVTIDDFNLVPLHHVQLPQEPDQRILANFTLTSTSSNPSVLAYLSIDKGPYYNYATPNEKYSSLYAVASGVDTIDLPKNLNAIGIDLGKHVEIVLVNEDAGEHPMHVHAHTPWIVGRGNMPQQGNPAQLKLINPVQRDTITIPGCNTDTNGDCVDVGYVVLRFNADNPGVWMLHCHIDWHLATGLTMLLVIGEDHLQRQGLKAFAPDMRGTCQNSYVT